MKVFLFTIYLTATSSARPKNTIKPQTKNNLKPAWFGLKPGFLNLTRIVGLYIFHYSAAEIV